MYDLQVFNDGTFNIRDRAQPFGQRARFTIDSSGKVGIGTTQPTEILNVESGDSDLLLDTIGDATPFLHSNVHLTRARTGRSSVLNGDFLGSITTLGYDGTDYQPAAAIRSIVDGDPGPNDMPSRIDFYTTADGSVTRENRMTIKNDGNVGIGTETPQSTLQVSGYVQMDLTSSAPPAADCDDTSEHGRMKVDAAAGVSLLYICTADGWVAK